MCGGCIPKRIRQVGRRCFSRHACPAAAVNYQVVEAQSYLEYIWLYVDVVAKNSWLKIQPYMRKHVSLGKTDPWNNYLLILTASAQWDKRLIKFLVPLCKHAAGHDSWCNLSLEGEEERRLFFFIFRARRHYHHMSICILFAQNQQVCNFDAKILWNRN